MECSTQSMTSEQNAPSSFSMDWIIVRSLPVAVEPYPVHVHHVFHSSESTFDFWKLYFILFSNLFGCCFFFNRFLFLDHVWKPLLSFNLSTFAEIKSSASRYSRYKLSDRGEISPDADTHQEFLRTCSATLRFFQLLKKIIYLCLAVRGLSVVAASGATLE